MLMKHMKLALTVSSALLIMNGCSGVNDLNLSAGTDIFKAMTISNDDMKKMAMSAAKESDRTHRVASRNSRYAKRLRRITRRLKSPNHMKLNYKVYLTKEMNAFAMPDGSVRVYSGLMDKLTDDELAFVIGHEIGHVVHEDSKKAYRMAMLSSAARKGVAAKGGTAGKIAAGKLGALVEKLANAQYSQSEESDADMYGLKFLKYNKRNPKAAVSALLKLSKGENTNAVSSLFSDHPTSVKRAEAIKAHL